MANAISAQEKSITILDLFLSLGLFLVFFGVGLTTLDDYWETCDEKFDQHIGEFYYNQWNDSGVEGLKKRFIELQRNYGPFFDVIVVASNDLFHKKLQWVDSVPSYHIPVLMVSSLTLFAIFWFTRLAGLGQRTALLAALCLALYPRFIGESQNNLKDTPLMFFFFLTMGSFYLAAKRRNFVMYFVAGALAGLTYSVKINVVTVFPVFGIWWLLVMPWSKRELTRVFFGIFCSLAAAFAVIYLVWPYYRYDTLQRFAETYRTFANHVWNEYVFYLGEHYRGQEVPWHYPLVMLGVATPVFYLVFALFSTLATAVRLARNWVERRQPEYSLCLLLILWTFIPPMVQAFSNAPMYDGIRHFLIVVPPLCLLVAIGMSWMWRYAAQIDVSRLYGGCIVISFLLLLETNVRIHPYQIVFYNSLVSGIPGARDRFELDYWGSSFKAAADWLNKNAETCNTVWLTMHGRHHFPLDTHKATFATGSAWCKVNLIRGMLKTLDTEDDYLHPRRLPIHEVVIDDAPMVQTFRLLPDEVAEGRTFQPIKPRNGRLPGLLLTVDEPGRAPHSTVVSQPAVQCGESNEFKDRKVKLSYDGYLEVIEKGPYCFEVHSDDTAILRVNGEILVLNPTLKVTRKMVVLEPGHHQFDLDLENVVGPACLRLLARPGECESNIGPLFAPIPDSHFSH